MKTKLPTGEETTRALLSLMTGIEDFEETAERIRIQVYALAERHRIALPRETRPS